MGSWSGFFVGLGRLFKLAFTLRGAVAVSLILIGFSLFGSVVDAVRERDVSIFVRGVGGELLGHDQKIYDASLAIEANGGLLVGDGWFGSRLWSGLSVFGRLFQNLWYMFTITKIFYWVAGSANNSAVFSNLLLAVLLVAVLQVAGHIYFGDGVTTASDWVPFRGLFKFFSVVPLLFSTVGAGLGNVLVNESVNHSVQNVSNVSGVDGFGLALNMVNG